MILNFLFILIAMIGLCGLSFSLGYAFHKRELLKFIREKILPKNHSYFENEEFLANVLEEGRILEGRMEITDQLLNFTEAKD